jgi:hypothetical protein
MIVKVIDNNESKVSGGVRDTFLKNIIDSVKECDKIVCVYHMHLKNT